MKALYYQTETRSKTFSNRNFPFFPHFHSNLFPCIVANTSVFGSLKRDLDNTNDHSSETGTFYLVKRRTEAFEDQTQLQLSLEKKEPQAL